MVPKAAYDSQIVPEATNDMYVYLGGFFCMRDGQWTLENIDQWQKRKAETEIFMRLLEQFFYLYAFSEKHPKLTFYFLFNKTT
jgi:hypothetical protein